MARRAGGISPLSRLLPRLEKLEDRLLPDASPISSLAGLSPDSYRSDRILVRFKPHINQDYSAWALPGSSVSDSPGLVSDLRVITLSSSTSVEDALQAYSANAQVEYAQPDFFVNVERTPNDPFFNQQWGLNNALNRSASITAPAAWDQSIGSGQTIVAVIDTGVDYNHPDLAANMWRNTREIPGNGIDDDGNGFRDDYYGYNFYGNNGNPWDDNGHGTHVAGIIGAVGNNGIGVTGINWNVKIMALKFMDSGGRGSTSDALRALNYAVANGAKISNNSWTSPAPDAALQQGIQAAGLAGHIYVVAAGNQGRNIDTTPTYPASYSNLSNVVTVAATDSSDRVPGWSNWGVNSVQIAAPGSGIYSTLPNNRYGTMSGTSMATPFVAGALALVRDTNPSLSMTQVIQRVLGSVDSLASLQGKVKSGGRLNLARALGQDIGQPPPPNSGSKVLGITRIEGVTGMTALRVSFDQPINPNTFSVGDVLSLSNPTSQSIAISSITAVSGSANTQFDIAFAPQTAAGNYSLRLGTDILNQNGVALDQNNNGIAGENPADQFFTTTTYSGLNNNNGNGLPASINDFATTTYTLRIDNASTINRLKVNINLTHGWVSDLVIKIRSPQGTEILLANRRGGGGKGYKNTLFDDQASLSITQGGAPFTGTYRPESSLASLNGQLAQGTWTLIIEDKARGDGGTLLSWSVLMDAQQSSAASILASSNRHNEVIKDLLTQSKRGDSSSTPQRTHLVPKTKIETILRSSLPRKPLLVKSI